MSRRPKPRTPKADIILSALRAVAMPGMTRYRGGSLAEACSVCLDDQGHPVICQFRIVGQFEGDLSVRRLPVTLRMKNTYNFESLATQEGAACLAILLLLYHTG